MPVYKLKSVYGRQAYERWQQTRPSDLRPAREDAPSTTETPWPVRSYSDLVDAVAFLSVMNKRLPLAFRGQSAQWPPVPTLLRSTWQPPAWSGLDRVALSDTAHCRSRLEALGRFVYEVCHERGLPRWRAMRHVHEARWAVVQHYELWPTPLLDLTRSLRVAASFALGLREGATSEPAEGFLDVVGLPARTGSISYSFDDQMLVADLYAVCPPAARRPHLQEGLLVGRFPAYGDPSTRVSAHDLRRRTIARFALTDVGGAAGFWSEDFPPLRRAALLPGAGHDPLLGDFQRAIEYHQTGDVVDWARRGAGASH